MTTGIRIGSVVHGRDDVGLDGGSTWCGTWYAHRKAGAWRRAEPGTRTDDEVDCMACIACRPWWA